MFEQILQEIRSFDRIIIHRHNHPDGDALGSQIGLKHILQENYPNKEIYVVGDAAGHYSFMDDTVMDEIPDEYYTDALAIILDTSAKKLISDHRYPMAAKTARMDHHIRCRDHHEECQQYCQFSSQLYVSDSAQNIGLFVMFHSSSPWFYAFSAFSRHL